MQICLAFGAFLTVLASLCMTIGVCFFFGLEFTGGREFGKQVPIQIIPRFYHGMLVFRSNYHCLKCKFCLKSKFMIPIF